MAGLMHTTTRTARKPHRCARCGVTIQRGERYLRHVASPGGELGFTGWMREIECAPCGEKFGRPVQARPPRELKPCGTPAAYRRHLRYGEKPCDACREAEYSRNRVPGGKPFQPAQHGTVSKYHGGCRCVDCTRANRDAARDRRARQKAGAR